MRDVYFSVMCLVIMVLPLLLLFIKFCFELVRMMFGANLALAFSPKALAAARMLNAVANKPLEATVLFSSLTSTVGNVGQANYGAANAYQDARALGQRRNGCFSSSLQLPAAL